MLVGFWGFGLAAGRAEQAASPVSSVAASDREDTATDLLLAQRPESGDTAAGAGQATAQSPPSDSLASSTPAAEPGYGLAGTPNMFGDLSGFYATGLYGQSGASLPLVGVGGRMKIAEDDSALPQDRVFFLYNRFNDALAVNDFTVGGTAVARSFDVDRYTLGIEKTFLDQSWSVELRMPFTNAFDYSSSNLGVSSGDVGNLTVVVKRVLYESETTAAAVGLGIGIPTGSNADVTTAGFHFTVNNQAVDLIPWVGFVRSFNDRLFCQGFLQVDVPANGNRIDLAGSTFGVLQDQTLLYADLCMGCWLSRNQCACWLTGLAALLELHYTSTLQGADVVSGASAGQRFTFGNFDNHQDVLDMTVGLHAEIADCTVCRLGGVFPLRSGTDRLFDSEVQLQLERR
jgi:hypothetical protein